MRAASTISPRRRSTRSLNDRWSAAGCSSAAPVPTSSCRRALAARVLSSDPLAIVARINEPGYAAVPPFHIYCWTLGFGLSPHDVALKFGHRDVYDLLVQRSPAHVRFINTVLAGDEAGARAFIAENPSMLASLTPADHSRLAHAIFDGRREGARLMLRLGFDPTAGGVDGGTALHAA